ncbi:GMP synthase [Achromatium sp. WMS2]|nr:GMP synthase [Achromatium sp. WMS2]
MIAGANAGLDLHRQKILIIDFGSQYTQLIARRVREAGVFSEIWPYDNCQHILNNSKPSGIILSGGPESVTVEQGPRAPNTIFDLGVPILGICYGMQTMAEQLGGKVATSATHEYGYAQTQIVMPNPLLSELKLVNQVGNDASFKLDVWMSHGDRVEQLPPGFETICCTEHAPIAGMADLQRNWYGLQFHPEVTHTKLGQRIIGQFLYTICGCTPSWQPAGIIQESITKIRETIGTDQVLLGLSGGVDSAVVAALLHQAIADQLICIFVDNGLLRLNEGDLVMETFAQHLGVKVIRINAAAKFFKALVGVTDPELKRKVIGKLFIEVFEEQASIYSNAKWLAQGTIYPDVIESAGAASGKAHAIKSHHNVGGLPNTMQLKLIEPLRELFKDEVRRIGVELGLPNNMVYRHPFPGPGLGVRILGEVKFEYAQLLRQADAIFIDELQQAGFYAQVSQAFAVFLPVKAVGVVGDARRYEYVISLRAVETVDFMTANFARLSFDFLDKVAQRIMQEVTGIARVVYDISSKPPATIEWE